MKQILVYQEKQFLKAHCSISFAAAMPGTSFLSAFCKHRTLIEAIPDSAVNTPEKLCTGYRSDF